MSAGVAVAVAFLPVLALVTACGDPPARQPPSAPPARDTSCSGLFGNPNPHTGLDTHTCFPWVDGQQRVWAATVWDAASLTALQSWTLDNPPTVLTQDPYVTTPNLEPAPNAVCAVMPTGAHHYALQTFNEATVNASIAAARRAGGAITHGGACGACSSLADLEVYVSTPDQTDPVRRCAASNLGAPVEKIDACIQQAVGFTPPCARIWAYNAQHDQDVCLATCLASILGQAPYNQPDGSLNDCLQCDEDKSGAVFKAIAGRTRRNSGIPAAICRSCASVWRIDHHYP